MRTSIGILGLSLSLVACTSSGSDSGATGLRIVATWESSLEPAHLSAWAIRPSGQVSPPFEVDVEPDVAPPGVRRQTILLDMGLPSGGGETVEVGVDGLAENRTVLATGSGRATLEFGTVSEISVRLFIPGTCPERNVEGGCASMGSADAGVPKDSLDASVPTQPPVESADFHTVERLAPASTTSAEFVDVPGATVTFLPGSASEQWLLLVSGLLGSSASDGVAAEMRMLVNGVESDLFGHQTRGGVDNWAGFLSFDLLRGSAGAMTITPQFRAATGTTSVSNLRVVLARLPVGANPELFENDGLQQRTGADLSLGELAIAPSTPGDYLVLARVSQRESPSSSTARTWLELPDGEARPLDDRGVRFSNSRDPWQPMFTAASVHLEGSSRFALRADSSAQGVRDWWDEGYRFRARITYGVSLDQVPLGAAVPVTFDHSALVERGHARPDGEDVRVVARTQAGWVELPRTPDTTLGFGRADTTLWVSPAAAGLDATSALYLYFGQPNAEDAPLPIVEDPPLQLAVTVGPEDSEGGGAPSQWRNARILAFRLDAFREVFYDASPGLTRTNASTFTVKNFLNTRAPAGPVQELVIQSMRISGGSSDTARRAGVLRAGGQVELETAHKINRDGGASGYHHNAAVARVVTTDRATLYENGLRSPDGISVEAADSIIIVLR